VLGIGAYFGITRVVAQRSLQRAKAAFGLQNWRTAREELRSYLAVYPSNDEARLRLAEAYFKDSSLNAERAVNSAIQQLEGIRRESPFWPAARIQEARMCLFVRMQTHRAEKLLRESLVAAPENVEAHYVLWKLLDLTGRSHLAEPHFHKVLESTPLERRPYCLREWYMSQFYPATANLEIDRLMGFLEPGAAQDSTTEYRRLMRFREQEPNAALNHADVARWFSLEGDPKTALEILQKALDTTDAPLEEPFFVATLAQVLFDLGEFDQALKIYQAWPGEPTGYEYFRLGAIFSDEVERDYEQAIGCYRKVIAVWPGPADWRIQNRLARCLAKAGQEAAAEDMRKQAKTVELLMENEVHTPLRSALAAPDQLEICQQMTQFYEQLGLAYETRNWREQTQRLESANRQTISNQRP
jgi:tetratricopeptide (TPR) repeat protein